MNVSAILLDVSKKNVSIVSIALWLKFSLSFLAKEFFHFIFYYLGLRSSYLSTSTSPQISEIAFFLFYSKLWDNDSKFWVYFSFVISCQMQSTTNRN